MATIEGGDFEALRAEAQIVAELLRVTPPCTKEAEELLQRGTKLAELGWSAGWAYEATRGKRAS